MPQGSGTLKQKQKQTWNPKHSWIDLALDKRWTTFIITAVYNCNFFLLQYNKHIEE